MGRMSATTRTSPVDDARAEASVEADAPELDATEVDAPGVDAPGVDAPEAATAHPELLGIAAELREAVLDGTTRPRAWREAQLDGVARMLLQNVSLWERALADDLGKSALEAHLTEIGYTAAEARRAKRSLRRWMAPTPVAAPLALQPAVARTVAEPLGVALIIAPWNYPLQLALAPLIGALAAGDAAVVKPSEVAPATSRLLAQLIPAYLDERAVRVVEGDAAATTTLLAERWDLIFYTGNGRVARIVAEAAAKHLTPTILELGGKSPVYVHRSADIPAAARRIAWGKWLNAGQTCVAPDHVLVDREVAGQLVEELRVATAEQLGEARDSDDFGRIVTARHAERLRDLLPGGTAVTGGDVDVRARYVAPTILVDVDESSDLMQEEIFGPLLPVLPIDGVDAFVRRMRGLEKPLALYVFARDGEAIRRVERETTSGGLGINVTVAHVGSAALPFGGVGESGSGAYHGRHSFEAFSHRKAVLSKPTALDTLRLVYPPIPAGRRDLIRRILG